MLRKARSPGCQSMWRWTLSPGDGSSGTDINNYDFFAAVPCYFVTSTRAFIAILVEICLSLSSIHLRTSKNICLRLCYAKDYHHVFLADGRTLRWCPCITPSRRKRTRRALSGSPSLTTRLTRRRLPISVRVTIYLIYAPANIVVSLKLNHITSGCWENFTCTFLQNLFRN